MTGVSLYNNKQMLDQARDRGEKLLTITKTEAYKDPAKADERSIRSEINATEELRELLVKLDDYERNGAPWFMRIGLYSGNRVYKQHLLKIYMSVIENRYKTATIKKIEGDLRKFADSNPVVNAGKLTDAEETCIGEELRPSQGLLDAHRAIQGKGRSDAYFDCSERLLDDRIEDPARLETCRRSAARFLGKAGRPG